MPLLKLPLLSMELDNYFSVAHSLELNIEPVEPALLPSSLEALESEIPEPFRLSSEHNQAQLASLNGLKKKLGDAGEALITYLEQQAERTSQILSYVLSQQADAKQQCQSTHFGGSLLRFQWPHAMTAEQQLRVKIFLPQVSAAVYCYAKVLSTETNDDVHNITCQYSLIREQDVDVLVRASLLIQAQQLKQRAQSRQNNS